MTSLSHRDFTLLENWPAPTYQTRVEWIFLNWERCHPNWMRSLLQIYCETEREETSACRVPTDVRLQSPDRSLWRSSVFASSIPGFTLIKAQMIYCRHHPSIHLCLSELLAHITHSQFIHSLYNPLFNTIYFYLLWNSVLYSS